MTRQLLKGIRVLDFTDFLAGPYPRLRRAVHCGLHLGRLYLHRRRHYVTVNNILGCHIFPFLAKSLPSRGLFVHFLGRFCNSHRFARISPPGRKIPPFRGYYGG